MLSLLTELSWHCVSHYQFKQKRPHGSLRYHYDMPINERSIAVGYQNVPRKSSAKKRNGKKKATNQPFYFSDGTFDAMPQEGELMASPESYFGDTGGGEGRRGGEKVFLVTFRAAKKLPPSPPFHGAGWHPRLWQKKKKRVWVILTKTWTIGW